MSEQGGAGWRPDPQGRHEHRYWDGNGWTDQVADGGNVSTDPMAPSGTDTVAVPIPAPVAPPGAPVGGPAAPPPGGPTPPPGAPLPQPGAPIGVSPGPAKKKFPVVPLVIGLVVLAAVIGGILLLTSGNESNAATNFDPGECTNDSLEGEVSEIEPVDCDEEHDIEAYGQFDLEGDDDDFPGDDEIAEEAEEECLGDLFEDYVGIEYSESIYFADFLPPTEQSWENGYRSVLCYINGTTDESDLEGSAEGTEE
jgi:hypothetical protein